MKQHKTGIQGCPNPNTNQMCGRSRGGDWSVTGGTKKHCGKAESDSRWLQKRKGWGGERRTGQASDEWRGKEQWLIDIEKLCCCKGCKRLPEQTDWDVCGDGVEAAAQLQHHHSLSQKLQNREETSGEDESPDLSWPNRYNMWVLRGPTEESGWRIEKSNRGNWKCFWLDINKESGHASSG